MIYERSQIQLNKLKLNKVFIILIYEIYSINYTNNFII